MRMAFKKWIANIQTGAYNGVRRVLTGLANEQK